MGGFYTKIQAATMLGVLTKNIGYHQAFSLGLDSYIKR